MGLDAQIIAIGPFSRAALPALDYPAEFYADVADGDTVITNVFTAITSDLSYELARCFGVGAMELGKHHLDSGHADVQALKNLVGDGATSRFVLLRDAGFQFYYLPNA